MEESPASIESDPHSAKNHGQKYSLITMNDGIPLTKATAQLYFNYKLCHLASNSKVKITSVSVEGITYFENANPNGT